MYKKLGEENNNAKNVPIKAKGYNCVPKLYIH